MVSYTREISTKYIPVYEGRGFESVGAVRVRASSGLECVAVVVVTGRFVKEGVLVKMSSLAEGCS